jgi:hypothetical protein
MAVRGTDTIQNIQNDPATLSILALGLSKSTLKKGMLNILLMPVAGRKIRVMTRERWELSLRQQYLNANYGGIPYQRLLSLHYYRFGSHDCLVE